MKIKLASSYLDQLYKHNANRTILRAQFKFTVDLNYYLSRSTKRDRRRHYPQRGVHTACSIRFYVQLSISVEKIDTRTALFSSILLMLTSSLTIHLLSSCLLFSTFLITLLHSTLFYSLPVSGIIPRVVEALFTAVTEADESIEFTFKVTYVEIYMEKIRDLLDESRVKVRIVLLIPDH
jgi:hypothetical protein